MDHLMHYQTPKTNMKPENPRLEKEKHQPKPPIVGFHVSFVGVQSPTTKTNLAPENRPGHHFRMLWLLVSGMVFNPKTKKKKNKTTQLELQPPCNENPIRLRVSFAKNANKNSARPDCGVAAEGRCFGMGPGFQRDGWGSYSASQDNKRMTQESSKSAKRLIPQKVGNPGILCIHGSSL